MLIFKYLHISILEKGKLQQHKDKEFPPCWPSFVPLQLPFSASPS